MAAPKYTCNDEMAVLLSIDASLKKLIPATLEVRGTVNGWNYIKVGKSWFYERTVTYDGNANTQDIDFLKSIQLNRIEQIWNDTTTKDFSVRVFSDTMIGYAELKNRTGSTATSDVLQLGMEYKYPAGARLRIYSGTNTTAKTDTIRVQVDEL